MYLVKHDPVMLGGGIFFLEPPKGLMLLENYFGKPLLGGLGEVLLAINGETDRPAEHYFFFAGSLRSALFVDTLCIFSW